MEAFLQVFGNNLKGWITGFDRLVFKGMLRPLLFAAGAQAFLSARGILNKEYKDWMLARVSMLVQSVEQFHSGHRISGIYFTLLIVE